MVNKLDLFEQYKKADREGQREIVRNASVEEVRQIFKKQVRESVGKIMKTVKRNKKHNLESDVDAFINRVKGHSGLIREHSMSGKKKDIKVSEAEVDAFVRACNG